MAVTTGKGKNGLSLSDEELIRRAKGDDQQAFCGLMQRFERRLFLLALHYTRDAHDAEDLSQEVWLKAYRAIRSFRGEASFYTWLRRIAVNTFLNHRRDPLREGSQNAASSKRLTLSLNDVDDIADARALDIEEVLHRRQLVDQVTDALAELTPQQRLIFLLKHREQMTSEEIAESCNVSTGTVKKSLFRAVHKIRERLGVHTETKQPALTAGCRRR